MNRWLTLFLATAVFHIIVCSSLWSSQERTFISRRTVDSLVVVGMHLYTEGRYEQAIKALSGAERDSVSAQTLFYLGMSYAALNDVQNAQEALRAAVNRDSLNVTFRFQLAQVFARAGAIDDALQENKRIVAIDRTFYPAFEQLGQLCEVWQKESTQFRDSIWSIVLTLNPRDYVALYYNALSMFRKEMPDSGFVCLRLSQEQNPFFYSAAYELASRNLTNKNYDEAFLWYSRAIELRPANARLFFEVGEIYRKMSKFQLSLPHLLRATQIDSSNASYASQVGLVYYSLGKFDSAAVYFNRAITIEKEVYTYYFNLALAYDKMDSVQQATKAFRRAITATHPEETANLYQRLGTFFSRRGKPTEARDAYLRSLDIDPSDVEVRLYLGNVYDKLNDRVSATREYTQYLRQTMNDTTKTAQRSMVKYVLKQWENSKTK